MRCFCKKIRSFHVKVVLLDEQELIHEVQDNSPGQEVLDIVFRHLNLLETAYFGLRYLDVSNQTHWLDPSKKIAKQLKGTDAYTMYFGVKFYAADPCKLLEEITRYQFFLQVKQDILQGRLPVTFDLAAELGAYVVQSELGDYDPRRHSPGYVSEFRFLSNQTVELESRISELHKGLIGQLPAVAELNYLDKVKWLEMYGVDLHPVLGEDNVEYFLGLTPSGIIVLRNKNKVGNYYWPRITKIYFKGRYFMLRVCDKNNDENTYGFETPSKPACKHLWKCCVEHHAFFRLVQVSPTTSDIFALGSRFRYSGRTEKQAQTDAQMRLRNPPHFTRTPSRRYQRRIVEGAQDAPKVEESVNNENIPPIPITQDNVKTAATPQQNHPATSLYRSTCSIPAALPSHGRPDSPRSTRSAPWTQPYVRGLYTSNSPRSVRSAGNNGQFLSRLTRRSSSVESQSSNDSRSCKKHRHHRSRRGSDNDSELSKCSGKSHGHRRHRHRSRGNKRDSGSEQDHHHKHKHKSSSKHRHGSHYELVDSEAQWKEVQRKQIEGGSGIHQATVVSSNRRSGYMNSGMETESEQSYHHKRKQKKHRSRSHSPTDGKPRLPDELKKHLEFDLIDTEGMSAEQLREIPYKAVETSTKALRVKLSPSNRRRSPRRTKSSSTIESKNDEPSQDGPPPPYTPLRNQNSEIPDTQKSSSAVNLANHDDVKRASDNRGSCNGLADILNKNSGSSSASQSPAGSIRTRSGVNGNNGGIMNINNTNNNPNSNNNLPRLPTSYQPTDYSDLRHYMPGDPEHIRSYSSALYDNPGTLLGKVNGHLSHGLKTNINANHEHSDSGVSGSSQDYSSYITERSSEGPKYAQTTKLHTTTPLVSTPCGVNQYHNRNSSSPSRLYHFGSQRVPSNTQYLPNESVHRHWGLGSGYSGTAWSSGRGNPEGPYSSPSAPSQGFYRSIPNSNSNNNWNGGNNVRSGPLYYQQHGTNSNLGILRDSNKFNTTAMINSGWGNEPETIKEDDESMENVSNNHSPYKSNTSSSNGQEVTHEMSTEL